MVFSQVGLFKKLELLGFKYVIRVSGTAWIKGKQFTGALRSFLVRIDQLTTFGQVLYQKKETYPVRLVYQFDAGRRRVVSGYQS